MEKNLTIELPILLAVEGKDEVNFFETYFLKNGLKTVQVVDVGGQNQFKNLFPLLTKTPGFKNIRALGIIRDAETDPDAVSRSIKDQLVKSKLPSPQSPGIFEDGPPRVGYFVVPSFNRAGMLENLCIDSVQETPKLLLADILVSEAGSLPEPPSNKPKAIVQAYLACMPEIVNSIGVAAKKDYWNFSADAFKEMFQFVAELVR